MRPASVSSMVSIPFEEQSSISSWRTVSVADDEEEFISLLGKCFACTDYLFSLWYIFLVPVGLALLVLPFEAAITLLYLLGSWCCSRCCCCATRATADVSPSPKRVNVSPRTLHLFENDEYDLDTSMASIQFEQSPSASIQGASSVFNDKDGGKYFLCTDYLFSLWYVFLIPVVIALLVLPVEAVLTLLYLLGSSSRWCCRATAAADVTQEVLMTARDAKLMQLTPRTVVALKHLAYASSPMSPAQTNLYYTTAPETRMC